MRFNGTYENDQVADKHSVLDDLTAAVHTPTDTHFDSCEINMFSIKNCNDDVVDVDRQSFDARAVVFWVCCVENFLNTLLWQQIVIHKAETNRGRWSAL